MDSATDQFIQQCVKDKFRDATVITIAHRLDTVADYDKIIVMDKGRVAEVGSPHELILKGGLFT